MYYVNLYTYVHKIDNAVRLYFVLDSHLFFLLLLLTYYIYILIDTYIHAYVHLPTFRILLSGIIPYIS